MVLSISHELTYKSSQQPTEVSICICSHLVYESPEAWSIGGRAS